MNVSFILINASPKNCVARHYNAAIVVPPGRVQEFTLDIPDPMAPNTVYFGDADKTVEQLVPYQFQGDIQRLHVLVCDERQPANSWALVRL